MRPLLLMSRRGRPARPLELASGRRGSVAGRRVVRRLPCADGVEHLRDEQTYREPACHREYRLSAGEVGRLAGEPPRIVDEIIGARRRQVRGQPIGSPGELVHHVGLPGVALLTQARRRRTGRYREGLQLDRGTTRLRTDLSPDTIDSHRSRGASNGLARILELSHRRGCFVTLNPGHRRLPLAC